MVRCNATVSEYFQVRKLLWDELQLNISASELDELQRVIGSHFIEKNEELRHEVAVLVEILTEFQQQNDDIRDTLAQRIQIAEPPGRSLLIKKLKLLVAEMHTASQSSKDTKVLDYVLSMTEYPSSPLTTRMVDLSSRSEHINGVPLRPGTASGRRPTTSSSRPVSRCSTISISSVSAVFESSEIHSQLNLEEIDGIKEDLRKALYDEQLLLLEDIEFIQGCLEMEKDLIDDDRQKVAANSPPSLNELREFGKKLEKSLEDQEANERMESIFRKASNVSHMLPLKSLSRTGSTTRVLKIRHIVQESRDESYLS